MEDSGAKLPETLAGMTILLAEDNPTNQMVAMQMLESLGAEVTLATDGAEALEILAERGFDVALIDIEMPRVSGLELIRQLRHGGDAVADMPMIALTAYVMREHRATIEDAGADGIIAKPILSIGKFGDDILSLIRRHAEQGTPRPKPVPQPAAEARSTAVPEPGKSGDPVIDRPVWDQLWSSFDPAARRQLAQRVAEDIGAACEDLAAAVHAGDFKGLRAATHVLISVAGSIGAVRLQSLAQCLNSAGHAADDSDLDERGAELMIEAERVLRFVRRG